MEKLNVIKCPNCGAEYLPVEMFIPDNFFGRPVHIERNEQNQIIDTVGYSMKTNTKYICDYCDMPFRISTKLQFSTKAETKLDFDSEYITDLKKASLFLSED